MTVELMSLPNCVQCAMSKRWLKHWNVPFTEIDMSENPEAADRAKAAGFLAAPVVFTEKESWSGFRPDKLMSLVQ